MTIPASDPYHESEPNNDTAWRELNNIEEKCQHNEAWQYSARLLD